MQIPCEKKFQIVQHCKTTLHRGKQNKLKSGEKKQDSISKCFQSTNRKSSEQKIFDHDLCTALLSSNIPLSKLSNENLRKFLEKYCKWNIPSERSLRRNEVDSVYSAVLSKIKLDIGDNYFYVCVDETIDSSGRYIAHLLIGALKNEQTSKSHLIASKQLDKTNALTISRFLQDSLANFFLPLAVPNEKLLLFLSDAAPYMVKAGNNLKIFYPRLVHTTCLAHGINRVAEEIRNKFPLINNLISNMKKIFLKAPIRTQFYREHLPNLPLPPQPVVTRWGTWLEAAMFYAGNFSQLKPVIMELVDDCSQPLSHCKELFSNQIVQQQLSYIKSNYNFVPTCILQVQDTSLSLIEAITIIKKFELSCKTVGGQIGEEIFKKLKSVLDKNTGFVFLSKVGNVLSGVFDETVNVEAEVLNHFKYAPITSVDVERTFSIYKHMYTDRRRNFLLENFEKHIITYCFLNK